MATTLRRISEDDLEMIKNWRMDPEITKYMNTNPKLTLESQIKWFNNLKTRTDCEYWVIEVDNIPAGVINLTNLDNESGDIGWAYYVAEKKLRSIKLALSLEMSMYDYCFDVLKVNSVNGDIFSLNKGVIGLHKMCGCEIVSEVNGAIVKEGIAYDVTYMRMTKENWLKLRPTKNYEKIVFDI